MQYRNVTKRLAAWTSFGLLLGGVTPVEAQVSASLTCNKTACFSNFTVPGSVGGQQLSVEDVNNAGTIVGNYTDSAGNTYGFERTASGGFTTLEDPQDTGPYFATEPVGISNTGEVAGLYINSANNAYEGFTLTNGTWATYVWPGLPPGSETALSKVNDFGGFCGFYVPYSAAPPYVWTSFIVTHNGADKTTFEMTGSTYTLCESINDVGAAAGYWQDSAGVYHGFIRSAGGTLTSYDAPGASTTVGSLPCPTQNGIGASGAGTIVEGINNLGDISGHFWDTSYNEHGFIYTHSGTFKQIDYPGAYQTSGGGMNDLGKLVGHYVDASCNFYGYIAQTF